MLTMGIDQSYTSTGIFILDQDKNIILVKTISSSKDQDFFDRAWMISQAINNIVSEYKPHQINMEDLAFGSIGNATRNLAGLQYVIVTSLRHNLNINCLLVPPTTLKKFATSKGNSKKSELYECLPDYIKTELKNRNITKSKGLGDVVDAYWLACYTKP